MSDKTSTKTPAKASTAKATAAAAATGTPISSDPTVPTSAAPAPNLAPPKAETTEIIPGVSTSDTDATGTTQATTVDVAAAATTDGGGVDAQAAAIAGQQRREATEAAKSSGGAASGPVPSGGIVRQLEDGATTDRRTGATADRSLAGENLPALRTNEPDPRQGVTTGDLTNPGVRQGDGTQSVTFLTGYHVYNRGESAAFSTAEAERLIALGVAE